MASPASTKRLPVRRDSDGGIYLSFDDNYSVVDGVPVRLMFAEDEGRIVCTRIEIGEPFGDPDRPDPKPMTTATLRAIPLGRLVDEALLRLARGARVLTAADNADIEELLNRAKAPNVVERLRDHARTVAVMVEATQQAKGPGRPPVYDDAHWKKVLAVYRAHGGRSPRKAVAEHFGVKPARASKWIKIATDREQGNRRG